MLWKTGVFRMVTRRIWSKEKAMGSKIRELFLAREKAIPSNKHQHHVTIVGLFAIQRLNCSYSCSLPGVGDLSEPIGTNTGPDLTKP